MNKKHRDINNDVLMNLSEGAFSKYEKKDGDELSPTVAPPADEPLQSAGGLEKQTDAESEDAA